MKIFVALAALILIQTVIAANLETANQEVVIDSVERSIDLSSQLVKISSKITLTNNGRGAIKGFHYAIEEAFVSKVAFIGATVSFAQYITGVLS